MNGGGNSPDHDDKELKPKANPDHEVSDASSAEMIKDTDEHHELDLALRIQALVRLKQAQAKTPWHDPKLKLQQYPAFLIGNDKPLSSDQLSACKINEPFILVGTSILRCVDLACTLADKHPNKATMLAKIFVIDNSHEVHQCWRILKNYFSALDDETILSHHDGATMHDALSFLYDHFYEHLFPGSDAEDGIYRYLRAGRDLRGELSGNNPDRYLSRLFQTHSISQVKQLICNAVVFRQDWTNVTHMTQIRENYKDYPIVVYPSNIISCISDKDQQADVLRAMAALQPDVCIYSNLDPVLRCPTQTYAGRGFHPTEIIQSLALDPTLSNILSLSKIAPKA